MVTLEELKTYTKEELQTLTSMIKELQKKGDGPIKSFFTQLNNEIEYTRNDLYELYKSYTLENKFIASDRTVFNIASNLYIDDLKINIKKRIKDKKEKVNKGGIVATKVEK